MFVLKTKSKSLSIFKTFGLQIVEQTPTILKLQAKGDSIRLFLLLLGIPFFLAGLPIIIFFGKLTTLKCARLEATQVACELTTSSLLGGHITPIPTGQLRGAEVEVNESSDGDTYRVALLTKNNSIPLSSVYSSGEEGKREKADQINAFIRNPGETSLIIQQDDRWFAYPFGGIFTLVGGGIILSSLMLKLETSCIFDKGLGRMYLNRQNILKKEETREYMLHEIKEAIVVEGTDKEGDIVYNTKLILSSGEQITLPTSGVSSNHYEITQSINRFLGIKS
jgi:hypothetical protein